MNVKALYRLATLITVLLICTNASAQSAPALKITSPPAGATVTPGQTISVTVEGTSDTYYQMVILSGEAPFGSSTELVKGSPPFHFNISVPTNISERSYHLTARGILADGSQVVSPSIAVAVTDSTPFTSIRVQPQTLQMHYVGEQINLNVFGRTAAAAEVEITQATTIQYATEGASIVTVSRIGVVTALGPGSTTVIVTFGAHSVTIPVSVPNNIRGDLNGDGKIDLDDLKSIESYLNTAATSLNDARDLNHDGSINALDARILTTLCTYPRCATHP